MAFLGTFPNLYYTGSLAEYAYSDQQVITAKSIDLASELITLVQVLKAISLKKMH